MVTRRKAEKKLPLTAPVEEGPYYKHGSPERRNIAGPGTPGMKLILEGYVLDVHAHRIGHAWLDFWQADGNGMYDNECFNLRGHQYADHDGHYRLETVKPVGYDVRAAHIHAKVRATKNSPVLTTQLFFPRDDKNKTDPIFEERTVVGVEDIEGGQKADFDFVIETEE